MRTAAAACLSFDLLAKKEVKSIGLIGLGNIMRATVEFILNTSGKISSEDKITLKLFKYKNQEHLFYEKFKNYKNVKFEYKDTYIETIENSDVVISAATYLKDDICPDKYFKDGITLIPIHTRGFMNCDLTFDKIFVDDMEHIKKFKYFNQYKHKKEISDLLNKKTEGRKNDKEKILVYNIGISALDVFYALKIYDKLKDKKTLEVDFFEPKEKFWI